MKNIVKLLVIAVVVIGGVAAFGVFKGGSQDQGLQAPTGLTATVVNAVE